MLVLPMNAFETGTIRRVKSSKELEEEELANMPKFKARPLNKMVTSRCSVSDIWRCCINELVAAVHWNVVIKRDLD